MDTSEICTLGGAAQREKLFDMIDGLRSGAVGEYIALPQIIVVGDQSSGKSSVLEAISRIRFPSKAELCTRFATELVLRRDREKSFQVLIEPFSPTTDAQSVSGQESADAASERVQEFNQLNFEGVDLPEIIQTASKYMGIIDGKNPFSKDKLRVCISGPKIRPLTLIDLPGFYHASNNTQTEAGQQIVTDLVRSHMKEENTIVLAVVSATYSPIMQQVLQELARFDQYGDRTLGIITKPDELVQGSSSETTCLSLLENLESSPNRLEKHGWHVLRNRGEKESDNFDERDEAESALFQRPPWNKLPTAHKGIESLRSKLGTVLESHIYHGMPALVSLMKRQISDCEKDVESLGEPRGNQAQRVRYLEKIAREYTSLAHQAVTGRYDDIDFFICQQKSRLVADNFVDRNLRATIRKYNRIFMGVMYHRGAAWRIVKATSDANALEHEREPWRMQKLDGEIKRLVEQYGVPEPCSPDPDELWEAISWFEQRIRGMDLPEASNPKMVFQLFKDQVQKWEGIARTHINRVVDKGQFFVKAAFCHVLRNDIDAWTRINLLLVQPAFDELRKSLQDKLEEILPRFDKTTFLIAAEDSFGQRIKCERESRARGRAAEPNHIQGSSDRDTMEDTFSYVMQLYKVSKPGISFNSFTHTHPNKA